MESQRQFVTPRLVRALRRTLTVGVGAMLGIATLPVLSAAAIEVPPASNEYFFQTSGPYAGLGIGDYYTSVDGEATDHELVIQVPCTATTLPPVVIDLFDPELNATGNSTFALDEIRTNADDATFSLTDPAGNPVITTVYPTVPAAGDPPTDNAWVNFVTIDPAVTGCGDYLMNITTGDGTTTVADNDDDNSWRARVNFNTGTDDADGIPGTGDELLVGYNRMSLQHGATATSSLWFFVDESFVGTTISLHNYDLDNSGTVTYYPPSGGTLAGTLSPNGEWNNSTSGNTPPTRGGDAYFVTSADVGWWRSEVTLGSGNQYIMENVEGLPSFPLEPSSPGPATPELTITKDDGVTTVQTGDPLTYTIDIANVSAANANPGPAYNVVVTDTLPTGFNFVGCTAPAGGSCSETSPGVVTFNVPNIAFGTPNPSETMSVDVLVTAAAGSGDTTNTAVVSYEDVYGSSPVDETATDTDTMLAAVDLVITKDDGAITADPGAAFTYTLTADQVGTEDLTGVVITETVPTNTTFDAASSTAGWNCPSVAAGTVCTFTVGAVAAADGPVAVQFGIVADDPYAAGGPDVANTATIADDGTIAPDANPADNTASDVTPVDAAPDLVATKVDTSGAETPVATPVTAGGTISYVVTITNNGNLPSTSTIFSDTPTGPVSIDATSVTTDVGTVTSSGPATVTVDIGTLASGATATINYDVIVDSPIPAGQNTTVNQGVVTNAEGDSVQTDDPSEVGAANPNVVPLDAVSLLDVAKTVSPTGDAAPGDTLTYTITASNTGTSTLTNIDVTDTLPAGVTLVGSGSVTGPIAFDDLASGDYAGGVGWTGAWLEVGDDGLSTCDADVCVINDTGSVPAGSNALRVQDDAKGIYRQLDLSDAKVGSVTTLDYRFRRNGLDNVDEGVSVYVTTAEPFAEPAGAASATHFGATNDTGYQDGAIDLTAFAGSAVYISMFSPAGGMKNDDGVFFDDFVVTGTRINSDPPTLTTTPLLTTTAGGNNSAVYTFDVTVDDPLDASIVQLTNQASADSDQTTLQVASVSNDIIPPTLVVTKTDSIALTADVHPGDTISYTVDIENTSTVSAVNVVFSDTPGTHTSLDDGSVLTTAGVVTSGNIALDTDVGVNIGTVAPGAIETITFDVIVDNPIASGVTSVANQGTVSADRISDIDTDDPETAAADATVTNISAAPVLVLTKTDSIATPAIPDEVLTYTLVVSNIGNTSATAVTVDDAAPSGTTFVDSSATVTAGGIIDQGNDLGETTVSVDIATLAAGASVTITFQVTVDNPVAAGVTEISNQATANSTEVGPVDSDDPDTVAPGDPTIAPLTAAPVLVVTKTDSPDPVDPGNDITYTIGYENTGNQVATSVVLSETVPANTTFEPTGSAAWTCVPNNSAGSACSLTIGSLAPGAGNAGTAAFIVTVDATLPSASTQIANTVTITGAGGLTDSASTTTDVNANPDLVVTKIDAAVTGPTVEPGENILYTVTIDNSAGTAPANAVVFTDTPGVNTTLVAGSVTTSQGSVTTGHIALDTDVVVNVGTVAAGVTVTITFTVTVVAPFPTNPIEVANQGLVASTELPDIPTDDPGTGTPDDPTVTPINAAPILAVTKVDSFTAPLTPGDPIVYVVTITNSGNAPASAVTFVDDIETSSSGLLTRAGVITPSQGSALPLTNGVNWTVGTIAAGASASITFEVTVDTPVPAGVTTVQNQGTVGSNELPDVVTDDPATGTADDPTVTPLTAAPDVTVGKVDNEPASVSVGDTIIYTVTASNIGNQAATAVVITETVPVGTTFDAAGSAAGWTCSDNDPAGTDCTLSHGALAGGGSTVDYAFAVTVDATATSGLDAIANDVSITDPNDSNALNNTASESTPLDAAPQLAVTKSDGVGGTLAGATDVYVIRVTNAGDQEATDVVVTETVPANTTFDLASSTAGWTCLDNAAAGSTCLFTVASIAATNGAQNISFAVTVDNPVPSGVTQIANTAAVTSEGGGNGGTLPGPVTDTNTLTAAPDLTVAKSDSGASVAPGGTVVYSLTVTNIGTQGSSGSTITETVPANSAFDSAGSTPGWACLPDNTAGSTCTFSLGVLAGGSTSTSIDFAVTADAPIPAGVTQLDNDASVADDGTNGAEPTGNNDASDSTPITGNPDLTLTKDDGQATIAAGSTLVYAITVDNVGNRGAELVVITETVPVGTTFDLAGSTPGWACLPDNTAGSTCTFSLGTVDVGDAADVVNFAVTVDTALASGLESIVNSASVADDGTNGVDPTGNNSADDTDTLDAAPDLRLTKSDAGADATPGNTVTYSLLIENVGDQASAGSTVSDLVPAFTTFNEAATTATWTCPDLSAPGTNCESTLGEILAGGQTTIDFVVTVAGSVPAGTTIITNSATVTDDGTNGADTDPSNDTEGETTPIIAGPVLAARKEDAFTADLNPGETITYTVTIDNTLGTTGATTVVFDDAVPANTTLVAGSLAVPSGATINSGSLATDTSVNVALGTIPAGATRVITFQVTVDDPVAADVTQISNQGTVSADGPISVPTDDPDTVPTGDPTLTPLVSGYDVSITKTDNAAALVAGGTVVYEITVGATGDQVAAGVAITETVPANTTFNLGASTAGWSCGDGAIASTTCTYDIGDLDATDAAQVIDFAVSVADPVPAGVESTSNTASVAATNAATETNTTNNDDTEPTPINASPDLVISKVDDVAAAASAGGTVVYTLTVANVGDQTAADVTITETVPVGSTFTTTGSTAGWSCVDGAVAGSTCTFDRGSIAGGTSATSVDFAVVVDNPLAAGIDDLANAARADDVSGEDATPADNSTTLDTPVAASPALTISKSDGGATITPGDTVAYTINYANTGNQAATGLVITETVPAGTTFVAAGVNPWSCVDGAAAGSTCVINVSGIAASGPGSSNSVTFTVRADDPFPAGQTELANSVTIVDDGTNGGTNPPPATDTTPVTAAPALSVSKNAAAGPVDPGSTLTYTVVITNSGDQDDSNVVFTDTPGANTTLVPGFVTTTQGTVTTGNTGGDTDLSIDLGTLAGNGGTATITFDVTIADPFPTPTGTVFNDGLVDSDDLASPIPTDDPDEPGSTDPTPTLVAASPDIAAVKVDTSAVTPIAPSSTISYSVVIRNDGTTAATNAVFLDTPDVNTSLVVGSVGSTVGGTVTTGNVAGDTTVAVDLATLAVNEEITVTFDVTVNNPLPGGTTQVANQGVVTADDGISVLTDDGIPPGHVDPTVTAIVAAPIVESTKTDAVSLNGSDQTVVTYTIDITNSGNEAATNVQFVDTPDAISTLQAASVVVTPSAGTTIDTTGGVLTVDLAEIAGQTGATPTTVQITFDVIVDEPLPTGVTSISNQGTVTADGPITEPTDDPDTGPDDDPTVTPIDFAPDLVVTKTDSGASVEWGDTIVYDVTYSNVGRQDATLVVVTETVPLGTTFNATASDAGWSCTDGDPAGTTCFLNVGALAAGAVATTVDFAVDVPNPVAGVQTIVANSVLIADDGTNGPDETPGDNNDSDSTPILTPPALTITKTGPTQAPATLIEPGDTITYTLAYENTGQTAATGVDIVDVVPVGTTFVAAGSDGGFDCTDGDPAGSTCTLALGTVAAGATGSVDIIVAVLNPSTLATVSNTATIDDDDTYGIDIVDDTDTYDVAITSASIGNRIWIDADEDGIQDPGELGAPTGTIVQLRDQATGNVLVTDPTGTDGAYSFDGLPSGDYTITVVTPAGYTAPAGTSVDETLTPGENNTTTDIAINQRGSIGDVVVFDANNSGVIDATETTGPTGVTVELFDPGDLVNPIATTTTGAGGSYSFANLLAGDYVVSVTPPTGFSVTTGNNPTRTVTVDPATNNVTDADFGIYAPATINGSVRIDADNSATLEAGETGVLDGVTISLLDGAGSPVLDGGGVAITTTTASDGSYSFTGLLPGTYQTAITSPTPTGFTATTPTNSGNIVLGIGDTSDNNDFGVFKPATIGDLVWYDVDGDGVKDANEPGIDGVVLTLTDSGGGTSTVTTSTVGGQAGTYDFTGLTPDTYTVEITSGLPADATSAPAGPQTVVVTIGVDENDVDFAITGDSTIGDTVYFDENADGTQQTDETTGVGGVTVQLLLDGVVVDTTVTATDGTYSFGDLLADDYTVDVAVAPAGTALTSSAPIAVTLPANDVINTADFGIAGTGSIGDTVFLDLDENGTQAGAGEIGVNGVVVTLSDGLGNPIATTTTATLGGIPGSYTFSNLPAGDYEITVDTTAVDDDTPYTTTTDGSAAAPFAVALGNGLAGNDNTIETVDIGINALGTISGVLFTDADEDGTQAGALETPVGGVTVFLLDASGNPVLDAGGAPITTTTSTTPGTIGQYTFSDLPAGDYQIRIDPTNAPTGTLPAGYDLGAATPNDAPVTLAAGADAVDIDFGINNPSTISGQVFVDPNEDGTKQLGEDLNGLANLTLALLDGAGDPITDDGTPTGTPITTTTDADGNYSFPGLLAGTYRVGFVDTTLPAGYDTTSPLTTGDIVLGVDDDEIDVDFGANKRGSLGDTLFYDLDGDGIQNGTEPGLAGVTVELLDAAGDPVLDGGVAVTDVTDASGNYSFANLLADDYQVRIVAADLPTNASFTTAGGDTQPGTVPVAATPTTNVDVDTIDFGVEGNASLGDQVFVDVDANGAQGAGETTGVAAVTVELLSNGVVVDTDSTDAAGSYGFTNLLAGTYEVRVIDSTLPVGSATSTTLPLSRTLANGDNINDADIGIVGSGSIGDRVWYDADADGLDNNGEAGLGGIGIILEDAFGNEIDRTTSAADGSYTFENLPAGTYVVAIDASTVPAGGLVTVPPPIAPIVLGDGTGGNDNTIDNVDIGVSGARSIGDLVYFDTNGNGTNDLGETDGVGGVTVELLDGTGPTATVVDSTTTALDGSYSFDNLFGDTYGVRVVASTLPTGIALTTPSVLLADVTIVDTTDADFGATGTNSIGDLVFFDADGDDLQGANEPGLGGVTLRLLDNLGNPVQIDGADATATTASDGTYSFDRIPGGAYSVEIVSGLPTGALADNLGTATVTVVSGDAVLTQDFAINGDSSIGDVVFLDADENEIQDVAVGTIESGQDGIIVVLLDGAGNELDRATTTTIVGVAGSYRFDGLIPGTYQVMVDPASLPAAGWLVTTDPATTVVALPTGTADLDNDFGITARGSIGDQIWIDADGDGARDTGELAWTGTPITLALLDATGAPVLDGLGNAITTTTDPTGGYLFDDVSVGDYQVRVVTGTLPASYGLTSTNDVAVSVTPLGSRLDIDFGINAPGSISGEVFADVDESGTEDPTETQRVQGVVVRLLDAAGDPVTDDGTPTGTPITTITGVDGSYSFTNLAPGEYQVEVVSVPGGYALTTAANSGPVAVAPDTNTPDVDFGANAPGTIGDVVYFDLDGDGTQDPGEPGLGGVTVELLDDSGNTVGTQITGTDGSYDFTDVNAGDYTVQLVGLPANTIVTTPAGGTHDVSLPLKGNIDDVDFGLRGPGSIGDEVFIDANENGVQSGPLEVGQPNVELILSVDAAGDGTFVEIARTLSATAAGIYDFTGLIARDYQVAVNPITVPTGYTTTTADPLAITVGDGSIGSPADIDTADVGMNALGTITGTVFIDADEMNGQDLSPGSIEVGQPGVIVELRDAAGNPVLDGGGAPITALTDADGDYSFAGVRGGTYTVRVQAPGPGAPLEDFLLVGANDLTAVVPVGGSVADIDFGFNNRGSIGDRIWIDSNADQNQDAGEPNASGSITVRLLDPNDGNAEVASLVSTDGTYLFDDLLPGDYIVQIDAATLSSGFNLTSPNNRPVSVPVGDDTAAAVTDADFGINAVGVIGDVVFYDANGDGIQQPGEPGIDGVTVTLTPAVGPVQTVTTSGGGGYTFTNLLAGDYVMSISNTPAGSVQTSPTADGGTYPLTLGVGGAIDNADFGLTGLNAIGGTVWFDTNGDGIQDVDETDGVGGVAVSLVDADGNVVATTVTAGDGSYNFPRLFDGTYSVSIDPNTLPTGTVISTTDPLTGLTVEAVGAVGQVIGDADAGVGVTGVNSIGDRIWFDLDADGIQDPTEPGVAGVQVRLVDGAGDEVRPAQTTGADGSYDFTNLPDGTFTVEVVGGMPTDAIVAPINPLTVTVDSTDGTPDDVNDRDIAVRGTSSIGDTVFVDPNANGVQDLGVAGQPDETVGLGGIVVELLIDSGAGPVVAATTVTAADGTYSFPNLLAGTYDVRTVASTLPAATTDNTGTITVTLPAATNDDSADFGVSGVGSIGDTVYVDIDSNQTQDTTPGSLEAGQDGVVLILTDSDDTEIARTTSAADGSYSFDNVIPGDYQVTVDPASLPSPGFQVTTIDPLDATVGDGTPGNPAAVTDADVGINALGTISGKVFIDADENGTQSGPLETDQGGITMILRDVGGVEVARVDTNPDGTYAFDDVLPGTYTVVVDPPTLPSGFVVTTPAPSPINLAIGATSTNNDVAINARGSIGDQVWIDLDGDGVQDTGETAGLIGVTVNLVDRATGDPVLDDVGVAITDLTDANGNYQFTDLLPGDYSIVLDPTTLASGYANTTPATVDQVLGLDDDLTNVDFGVNAVATIDGTVFWDIDADTNQAGNEPGLDGIAVELVNTVGDVVATATTLGDGTYGFDDVNAGNYTVRIDQSTLPTGAALTTSSDVPVSVDLGDAIADINFGANGPGTIGDTVFVDADADGIQDTAAGSIESGLAGGTVILRDDTGTELDRMVTDADGGYLFTGLFGGDYTIELDPASVPADAVFTTDGAATDPFAVTLADTGAGATVDTADIGLHNPGSITGTLFVDADSSGTIDLTETDTLDGVTVNLLDAGGNVVDTTATGIDGTYVFVDVPAGTYTVQLDVADLATDHVGYGSTLPDTQPVILGLNDDRTDVDFGANNPSDLSGSVWIDVNNDDTRDAGETTPVPDVTTIQVVLFDDAGNEIDRTNLDTNGDFTFTDVPAGIYDIEVDESTLPTTPVNFNLTAPNGENVVLGVDDDRTGIEFGVNAISVIGDTVWFDTNGNGTQDPDETYGLEGIDVVLFNAVGTEVDRVQTDNNGQYRFLDLAGGDYTVGLDLTTRPDLTITNAGPVPIPVTLGVGAAFLDADFGVRGSATIGDEVFFDINGDGIEDAGDSGEPGIVVILRDANGDEVDRQTTDGSGNYTFTNIPAGTYSVEADPATLPVGYSITTNGDPATPIAVTVADGSVIDTADVGLTATATIGDTVFLDVNGNGVQDATEVGQPGVDVVLLDGLGVEVDRVTTGSDGTYAFTGVDVGTYTVTVDPSTLPDATYIVTTADPAPVTVGPNDVVTDADFGVNTLGSVTGVVFFDLDADGVNDPTESGQPGVDVVLIDAVGSEIARVTVDPDGTYTFPTVLTGDYIVRVDPATLPPGAVLTTPPDAPVVVPLGADVTADDIGVTIPGSVSGTVFIDPDRDGNRNVGDVGYGGVTVVLIDGFGNAVATTTSGPDGTYSFSGVLPGDYTAAVFPLRVAPTGPVVIPVTISTGDDVVDIDFGVIEPATITGTVFFDTDIDAERDPGEPGAPDVVVRLFDIDGTIVATTVAAPDGSYSFTVFPGVYTVDVDPITIPPGTRNTTPTSSSVDLTPEGVAGPDFGFIGTGSIGDTVFADANHNGVHDLGERGLVGVTLTLLDVNGNVIDSVVTGGGGTYGFTDLLPGAYTLRVDGSTLPVGYVLSGSGNITLTLEPGTNDLTIDVPLVTVQSIPRTGGDAAELLRAAAALLLVGALLWLITRRREDDDQQLVAPWGPPTR